ncbi:hypothetical protein EU245_07310 [Lentibacillus lipolyticus]|nr:hypothetical protein EU245_07310 [Lentibacillus lipolyticus]
MSKKKFQRAYWISMLFLLLPFIFPLFEVANRPIPLILGLPFSLFWVCLWTFITFFVILIFYFIDPERRKGR